ncbi:MAG: POTRA domain-containing protein, partial [Desulfonatronovibrionaceae bacterium]
MLFQKVDYRFVSGLFLALLLALLQTTAVRPACAQDSIAVLPFEINAPEEMSHLESDLPALLVDELRDKGLHVLDMDKIQSVIDSRDISVLDLEEARRLTLAAESRYAVYGSLSSVEEYISLDVRLVDGFQEKQTVPFHISKQGLINILPAVEELADKIYEQMRQEDRIASIEVQGTETLDPDVILLHLNMQEGDLFEPEMLNEELNRIYELGYFEDVQLEARETPDGRHVLIIVEEKPRIQNINILGADKVKEKDIRQSLSTTTGSVLNQEIISEDLDKIRELYRGKGYYNATVDYTVSPINQRTANLNIRINEGNKLYIQGIEIKGAESFSQRELRKEMILKKRGFLSWLTGKGVLREELLDRDAAALEAYYANQGFIDARVGQPDVEYE